MYFLEAAGGTQCLTSLLLIFANPSGNTYSGFSNYENCKRNLMPIEEGVNLTYNAIFLYKEFELTRYG
jgi:hypothetical protein